MQERRNSQVLKETLNLQGKTVLDIGSGEGHLTRMMTKSGAIVIGLECSKTQLAKARSYEAVGSETYLEGIAQTLPFDDGSMDIVVFFNSLHHVPVVDQTCALAEAVRVLKYAGQLYISEPIATGAHFQLLQPVDDETYVRAKAYEAIKPYEDLGLKWVKEETYNHPVRRESYEELKEKLLGPNPERAVVFREKDEEMRKAFETLGVRGEDGFMYFDQPTRMNLLQKT